MNRCPTCHHDLAEREDVLTFTRDGEQLAQVRVYRGVDAGYAALSSCDDVEITREVREGT